LHIILATLLM